MVLPGALLASRMVLRDAVGVYPDPVGTSRSFLPGLDDFPDRTVALLPARSDLVGGMLFFPTEVLPAPLLFNLKLSTFNLRRGYFLPHPPLSSVHVSR